MAASAVQARSPKAHPKRTRFAITALCFSVLLGLGICEIGARILFGSPLPERLPLMIVTANRYRGYAMVPNSLHYTYEFPVRVNNLGLRGDDVDPVRQPGERRVFVLGDSLVYGQGVADDQTIPYQMQRRLNDGASAGHPFVVVNGGVRGYSTDQELGVLREFVTTVKPDVVVLFWYWNDLVILDIDNIHRSLSQTGPFMFDIGAPFEGLVKTEWTVRQVARKSALLMWLRDATTAWTADPATVDRVELCLRQLDQNFAEFKAMSQQHHFSFVLAIIPDPNRLRSEHVSSTYVRLAESLAQGHDMPSLDLLDAVKSIDTTRRLPIIPYDAHYDANANSAMAAATVDFLRRQLPAVIGRTQDK